MKIAMLMLYSDKRSNKHKEQSDGYSEYIVQKAVECQYDDILKHEDVYVEQSMQKCVLSMGGDALCMTRVAANHEDRGPWDSATYPPTLRQTRNG